MIEKFKLDLEGFKLNYNIDDLSDELIISKIKELGLEENILEIRTGRGAERILFSKNSKYNIVIDNMFEPLHAEDTVNPILKTGRRLSSYILYIINNGELIKLVPKNPKLNLEISK